MAREEQVVLSIVSTIKSLAKRMFVVIEMVVIALPEQEERWKKC